jgi:hypothetical protein
MRVFVFISLTIISCKHAQIKRGFWMRRSIIFPSCSRLDHETWPGHRSTVFACCFLLVNASSGSISASTRKTVSLGNFNHPICQLVSRMPFSPSWWRGRGIRGLHDIQAINESTPHAHVPSGIFPFMRGVREAGRASR